MQIDQNTTSLEDNFNHQVENQWVVARSTAAERIYKLKRLHDALLRHQADIREALWADLRKSPTEVDITEISTTNSEIRYAIKHLRAWMATKHVGAPMALFGSRSEIRYEPKGVCLIISPWNFPLLLTLGPLASAIAAGNCVVIKPSEHAPATAAVMRRMVTELFSPEEVCLVEGDAEVAQALLAQPFNHIFFTGSPQIGKIVMEAAAKHLSSVTLELGGKNPVIVDETADLDWTAGQLAWFKGMNAGQSCVEPDYVLVHANVHDALLAKTAKAIEKLYGTTPEARQSSPDLCRLIHQRHFERAKHYMDDAVAKGAHITFGGRTDAAERYMETTLLQDVPDEAELWSDELFSPLLPFRAYQTPDEAIAFVQQHPRPLAFYIFSRNQQHIKRLIQHSRAGTTVVNDIALQFYNSELPFGGVNYSGMGKGHGHFAFLEFSNARAIVRQNSWLPVTRFFRPPYAQHPFWVKSLIRALTRWL